MNHWSASFRILIAVLAAVLIAFAPNAIAQRTEDFKLLASDGAAVIWFGTSVSIRGDVAIVGAVGFDGTSSGLAYVYRKSLDTSGWVEEAKLLPSSGWSGDLFGHSVSISGDVAIVGAHRDNDNLASSGSAYIYRFNGENWVEEAKLLASDGTLRDLFGFSVSISGNIACIGAFRNDDNGTDSGSAYIYRFNPDTTVWTEDAKLLASDGEAGERFGWTVAISGTAGNEVAIVGAVLDNDNGSQSGSAYIFRFNPNTSGWVQEVKLLASDGAAGDHFGSSVSISGTPENEVVIVGAVQDDENGSHSGSAYIYRNSGANWIQETKLLAFDGAGSDHYGISVSISAPPGNEVAIIGAPGDNDNGFDSGSAYIYRFNTDTLGWEEELKLLACSGAAGDSLGWSVSISGAPGNEVAIAGAWKDDDNGPDTGSAYIFELANTPCPGDFNNSGTVNVFDLLTLLTDWGPNPDSPADTNCDENVNVTDLLAMLAAWGDC